MNEHSWVEESLGGYLAGGLDHAEREQLERHVADCPACQHALEQARGLDGRLDGLFAPVRPTAALEDRMIQVLRRQPLRGFRFSGWKRVLAAAAAVVLLGGIGAGAAIHMEGEEEPGYFFGLRSRAENALKQIALLDDSESLVVKAESDAKTDPAGVKSRRKAEVSVPGRVHELQTPLGVDWGAEPYVPQVLLGDGSIRGFVPDKGADQKTMLGIALPSGEKRAPSEFKALAKSQELSVRLEGRPVNSDAKYFRPGEAFAKSEKKPESGKKGFDDKLGRDVRLAKPGDWPVNLGFGLGQKRPKDKEDFSNLPQQKLNSGVKPVPRADNRKIIRTGELDFEVESFDDAVAAILKLVGGSDGGFVATINSDKLANGKVKGAVVSRIPPGELDRLVGDLRKIIGKMGDLKGQRIGSQDITKQYTDTESRLKAARTMEERLLRIIKDGKGEIKDLVAAEKELGVWRTKIEEFEGEIRYYANQVSLSTLTVNLMEKDLRLAAAVAERERIQAGIEVDDVEKAYREAQKAIADLKGRITRSELKQGPAGQFNALLFFEMAPESAGLMRDRLRQLGTMVRLEIDRVLNAEGGKMPLTGRLNRGDTQFQVSLYNLANVEPRETITLKLAASDVAKAFGDLRAAVAKAKGQVLASSLNEQDRQNITAVFDFNVLRSAEPAVQAVLNAAGEMLTRQVSRVPESDKVTDARVRIKLELVPASAIPPRESIRLLLEVSDVAATFATFNEEVRGIAGRVVEPAKLRQERTGKVLGRAVYDVPLASSGSLLQQFKDAGRTSASEITPNPNAPEGKLAISRIEVVATNAELLVPRDQTLWSEVRQGIATSLRGLSISAGWLIIGILFVLPWLVLLYAVVWLTRRLLRRGAASQRQA